MCCTRCGDTNVIELPKEKRWQCRGFRYQFNVTSGTIMLDSRLPLRKWLIAIFLMVQSKKGMSALQLKRTLGVAYETAWYLCHRIREAMGNDPFTGPAVVGVVEVDETWIGGKTKGKGHGDKGNKMAVAGAIQRGGQVRIERIPNLKRQTLHDFIDRAVAADAETVYTDELRSYLGIDFRHETVNHSAEERVVGDVHTNSIESAWSLFQRSILGAFHKMSVKHPGRYLEELEWRFNNRDNRHIFRVTLERIVHANPMTYDRLVGKTKNVTSPKAA